MRNGGWRFCDGEQGLDWRKGEVAIGNEECRKCHCGTGGRGTLAMGDRENCSGERGLGAEMGERDWEQREMAMGKGDWEQEEWQWGKGTGSRRSGNGERGLGLRQWQWRKGTGSRGNGNGRRGLGAEGIGNGERGVGAGGMASGGPANGNAGSGQMAMGTGDWEQEEWHWERGKESKLT